MTTVAMNQAQQARLQAEVQTELEKREWAESGDQVMAEYITVLIANGSDKGRVQAEMDDLVGADFDPAFLHWLFSIASDIQQTPVDQGVAPETAPSPAPPAPVSPAAIAPRALPGGGNRMLNTALSASRQDTYKRKNDVDDGPNKRRISDHGVTAPSAPRSMAMGQEGRSLQSRISGRSQAPMAVRGAAGPRMGNSGFQPQLRNQMQPGMMQPGFPAFQPGQQEMMAQMMMMQANMAQMGEMMAHMVQEKEKAKNANTGTQTVASYASEKPARPVKVPHGTKLGAHSVSAVPPKASIGPIPTTPSSTALCKYSVGCTNSRCIYSHPSPVSDEKTGMVLSEAPCEAGKECKDAECVKSHVSPAVTHGDKAGPARSLCKYQNCTNPACPFRHEDANGNPIPPPALSKPAVAAVAAYQPSSDNEDGDIEVVMTPKSLLDGPLDDKKQVTACRYGERCTRADCKFSHPASRPTPRGRGGSASSRGDRVSSNGMSASKKFTQPVKLNPGAGEFVPPPTNETAV